MGFILQGVERASVWGICRDQDWKQRHQEVVAEEEEAAGEDAEEVGP